MLHRKHEIPPNLLTVPNQFFQSRFLSYCKVIPNNQFYVEQVRN